MLDDNLKTQLASAMSHLRSPVKVSAYLDASPQSEQVRSLLNDLASSSAKIELVEVPSGEIPEGTRIPSFGIHRPEDTPRVFFAGLPLGHEFTSLVLAVLHVSGHPPRVSEESLRVVDGLGGDHDFSTYFSQSCQNCPEVVQALNLMAARNPHVRHVAVDGAFFQDEVEQRQVMAVPTVLDGDEAFGQGRMELEQILEKVDTASGDRKVAEINARDPFDVLIVGGGPAGAAAAIYAARKGISTGVVADRFGGQVLDTLAIENFISVTATQGPELASALEAHVSSYPVDVMKHQRAKKLVPGELIDIELDSGAHLQARSVILATGARWRDMNVPGEAEYRNRGVTYCPHCDGPLFKGKDVAVVGGGNSGVEAAIDLAGVVRHVTLLEFADSLKADDILQRKLHSLENVKVITSAQTTEIVGDGKQVTGLRYCSRTDESEHELELAGVFVQIGLIPNTDWLKGTVDLSRYGEVEVGARGETSVPGVFAAGDVTTTPYKQIIIATGDGAKAALGAFDHLIRVSAPAA